MQNSEWSAHKIIKQTSK